jgi:FkbM family methyltransferase
MLHTRAGTLDQYIYEEVVERNEYRLPDRFESSDVVVDIGVHIGAFAHAALIRGCGHVSGVEADLENLRIATENLRRYIDEGAATLTHGAAWRSDFNDDHLSFHGYPSYGHRVNTGGGRVLPVRNGKPLPKVNFDVFLLGATRGGEQRVRFLKLDCEGSEWPILLTSKRLDLVDEIAGEFHELGADGPDSCDVYSGLTCEDLGKTLSEQGFDVTIQPYPFQVHFFRRIGLFFAKRKEGFTYRKRSTEK